MDIKSPFRICYSNIGVNKVIYDNVKYKNHNNKLHNRVFSELK